MYHRYQRKNDVVVVSNILIYVVSNIPDLLDFINNRWGTVFSKRLKDDILFDKVYKE